MSPFKKSTMKGGSSKGKEPVIDLDSLTLKSKKTHSSIGFYDADKFRSYAASQAYENYFKDAPHVGWKGAWASFSSWYEHFEIVRYQGLELPYI